MLDYLLSPHEARKKPFDVFFVAIALVSFAVLVELFLPSLHGSIIIFAMIPAIPLMRALLIGEEASEEKTKPRSLLDAFASETGILARHGRLIRVFSWFFLGAIIAYAAWYVILPPETAAAVYDDQLEEVKTIFNVTTAWITHPEKVAYLFSHNMQVLGLMFLFSLLHGAGAIYLLLWNASIIGVVIGNEFKAAGLAGGAVGFLGLVPHGVFELAGYFVASLSGGILSVGLMRGRWKRPGFKQVLVDAAVLAVIAIILVFVGSAIEGSY